MICPTDHRHGRTGTCYVVHKCRCAGCREGNAARERRRTRLKAYGRYDNGLVGATPVRAHVYELQAYGIGYMRAARLAGVQPRAVAALIYGRQESGPRKGEMLKRIKRETAEKILAVQPVLENLGDRALTPGRGTRRRLQALVALGWSMSRLADELGMARSNFGRMMTSRMVRAETARAVAALYDRLSNTRPPEDEWRDRQAASRARSYARARGWPVPMDWEAVDNDFDRHAPVRRSAA